MKSKSIKFTLVVIGILIGVVGVSYLVLKWQSRLVIERLPPNIAPPIEITKSLALLSSETVGRMSEVVSLDPPGHANGVVSLTQPTANKYLLVVYGNGIFRRWDLDSRKIVTEFNFLSANKKGVNFSADGSIVITPGKVLPEGLSGYNVWDTESGERLDCWGAHCPTGDPEDSQFVDTGIVLEPNSKWIIDYSDATIGAVGIRDNIISHISIDYPYDNQKLHISRVILDQTGSYLAYSLEEGRIAIFNTKEFLGFEKVFFEKSRNFGSLSSKEKIRTVDMTFDDTRSWLAWLNDKELIVWDLRKLTNANHIKLPIDGGIVIMFNHAGNLLAVGTENGFFILSLEKGEKIEEFNVGEVTALYFTKDDRALLWGDTQGGIHVWGIRPNN